MSNFIRSSIENLALMFENHGHIDVYRPGAEADNPLGSNLVIFCKFFPISNDFVTVFLLIQTHRRPNLTLL